MTRQHRQSGVSLVNVSLGNFAQYLFTRAIEFDKSTNVSLSGCAFLGLYGLMHLRYLSESSNSDCGGSVFIHLRRSIWNSVLCQQIFLEFF